MTFDERLIERFDHYDPALVENPYEVFAALREGGAPRWSDAYGGVWVVSSYRDVYEVAHDPETFSSASGVSIPSPHFSPKQPLVPIEIDPPRHRDLRQLASRAFSPEAARGLEDDVRRVANELIDDFIGRGRADLASEFAFQLPTIVISWIMGVDVEDRQRFRDWTVGLLDFGKPDAALEAAREFSAYCRALIGRRRGDPRDDITSTLVQSTVDGRPLTDRELLGYLIELIAAGHETTTSAIGSYLLHLGSDDALRDRLVADPTLIPGAVEEFLRFESPVQVLQRRVTRDVVLGGTAIRQGDTVVLLWGSANRDSAEFTDADEFDLDRFPNRHIAFGSGMHRCLGSHLARLELRVSLEEVLRRMPDYHVVPGGSVRAMGITRGVRRLEVTFAPGPRETTLGATL